MQTTINGKQLRDGSIERGKLHAVFEANLTKIETDIQTIFNTMSTDAERLAAIDAITTAWTTADGSLQTMITSMVNATRIGAGLENDGSFVLPVGQNYLTGATSLKSALGLLDAALKTEETARIAGDASLQGSLQALIDSGAASTQAALATETAARIAADADLQDKITAETAARITSDTSIQNALNTEIAAREQLNVTLSTAIAEEASARTAADSAETAARTTAINNEAAARSAADTELQNNLASESLTRAQADAQLSADLSNEATIRAQADTEETAARIAGDTALETRIIGLEATTPIQLTYDKIVSREIPAGAINGINMVYTLADLPHPNTEHVMYNGQELFPGVGGDYLINGKEITLAFSPYGSDKLWVNYFR